MSRLGSGGRWTLALLILGSGYLVEKTGAQTVSGLAAERVVTGLNQPLFVTAPPRDFSHLYIVTRGGVVQILDLATGEIEATPLVDLSAEVTTVGERGLLGFAFDPSYSSNKTFYVNYITPGGASNAGTTRISQFAITGKKKHAHLTETILLSFDQLNGDHNGGWIGFSPRPNDINNLYIATGDGGCCNDQGPGHLEPGGNGQNTNTLLGKILRIDVHPRGKKHKPIPGYAIPTNNPFANSTTSRPEVWAYGFRNPFRASFDRLTGDLFIGDVGQDTREELDVQKASNPGGGENYGWRLREGSIATPTGNPPVGGPAPAGSTEPILDYDHSVGRTLIGGCVYRGQQIPSLQGTYLFADYIYGRIFALNFNSAIAANFEDITKQLFPTSSGGFTSGHPTSLGEDANGELYIADIANGSIFKIVPAAATATIASVTPTADGHNLLRGTGVPFKTHTVQAALGQGQPFISIGTVTAEGDGNFQFDDPNAATFPGRVYCILPP